MTNEELPNFSPSQNTNKSLLFFSLSEQQPYPPLKMASLD
jgi:hypothetical protein